MTNPKEPPLSGWNLFLVLCCWALFTLIVLGLLGWIIHVTVQQVEEQAALNRNNSRDPRPFYLGEVHGGVHVYRLPRALRRDPAIFLAVSKDGKYFVFSVSEHLSNK